MVLTTTQTFTETHQPANLLSSCVFNGLVASKAERESFEAWIATLTKLAEQQDREAQEQEAQAKSRAVQARGVRDRVTHDQVAPVRNDEVPGSLREIKPPLEKLADGPWRSLGGYFDYSLWPERERFLELDRAIAAGQDLRDGAVECDIEMV
jgi:hypothetical protein